MKVELLQECLADVRILIADLQSSVAGDVQSSLQMLMKHVSLKSEMEDMRHDFNERFQQISAGVVAGEDANKIEDISSHCSPAAACGECAVLVGQLSSSPDDDASSQTYFHNPPKCFSDYK